MKAEIRPFETAIGAEVVGADLARPLDEATHRTVEDAWNRHSVLVFRGQKITEEQHIAFSARFGALEEHVLYQYLHPKHAEIFIVSNVKDESGRHVGAYDAGRYWHTDLSYMAAPSRGSILYAIEIPHADDGTARRARPAFQHEGCGPDGVVGGAGAPRGRGGVLAVDGPPRRPSARHPADRGLARGIVVLLHRARRAQGAEPGAGWL